MFGDAFKRIMPEQPLRFPAKMMNAMLEGIRARASERHGFRVTPKWNRLPAGVVLARNVSSGVAPRYGVCRLIETLGPNKDLWRFDKASTWSGIGILLEPVPAGYIGRVAWSGGPWRAKVPAAAATGAYLRAKDSAPSWELQTVNPRALEGHAWLFQMSARINDGTAWVKFGEGIPLGPDGAYPPSPLKTVGSTAEGSVGYGETWRAYQDPAGRLFRLVNVRLATGVDQGYRYIQLMKTFRDDIVDIRGMVVKQGTAWEVAGSKVIIGLSGGHVQ